MWKTPLATLVAAGALALVQMPAHAAVVNVLHGSEAETVTTTQVVRGAASVIRGRTGPETAAPAPAVVQRVYQPFITAAGDYLWLVKPDTGDVVACWVRGTSTVGLSRIDCTSR